MAAFFSIAMGWITGPFTRFLKSIPPTAWYIFIAILTMGLILMNEKSRSYKKGKAEGDKKVEDIKEQIKEINHDTEQRVENAEKAALEIEEQLFDGGDYTTDDLNHQQLRKLAENDPNNRRRGL